MPAGGEARHCPWPLQVTSEPPSWAYFPLTTVLAVFQSVGQDKQPHLGLVYSPPQCPTPGTGGHYSNLRILLTDFTWSPLLLCPWRP